MKTVKEVLTTTEDLSEETKEFLRKYPEDWLVFIEASGGKCSLVLADPSKNPSLLVGTFFDGVTALKLMKGGKMVSRKGNPLMVFKIRKGIMDTDLIDSLSPLGFPKELYDHGDRGCETEPPEIVRSNYSDWRWEKTFLTSEDLLANDWFLL